MRKRKNVVILFTLMMILFCATGLHAKKYYTKSKDQQFLKATDENAVIYLIHKDINKAEQYIAVDDELMILPNKTYTVLSVSPGWHLLSVAHKEDKHVKTFEIYCYPGETQILNVVVTAESNAEKHQSKLEDGPGLKIDINLSGQRDCHFFFFDRYPSDSVQTVIKKRKLKFAETTDEGREKLTEIFNQSIQNRNLKLAEKAPHMKFSFEESVAGYPLPTEAPIWKESWEFEIKAAPGDVGIMKLGMRKKSKVFISNKGIDIKNEKKPERDKFIPFESITGFERLRSMGRMTFPNYLVVNFTEEDEEKQYRFYTGEAIPLKSGSCTNRSEKDKTGEQILPLDRHDTQIVGYHKLVILNDVMFWFDREKAKLKSEK